MKQVAKVFMTGRSQAVRLPAAFRFKVSEVSIRRDPVTGDVILSDRPAGWGNFFEKLQAGIGTGDFLDAEERLTPPTGKDPFEGWKE